MDAKDQDPHLMDRLSVGYGGGMLTTGDTISLPEYRRIVIYVNRLMDRATTAEYLRWL